MSKDIPEWAYEFGRFLEPRWHEFWLIFDVSGKVSRYDFEGFLQMHHYHGDERVAFEYLDPQGSGFITAREMLRYRNKLNVSQKYDDLTSADFKNLIKSTYGTLFHGFRKMDARNKGIIFKADFSRECQTLGFKNSQSVWKELSKDGNVIDLATFDPQAAHALRLFSRAIFAKHRTASECWKWTINGSKYPRIGVSEFIRASSSLNINESIARFVFECLEDNKAVNEKTFLEVMSHWDHDANIPRDAIYHHDGRFAGFGMATPTTARTSQEFNGWALQRWKDVEGVFRKKSEVNRFEFEEYLRMLGYPHDEKAAVSLLAAEGSTFISYRRFQLYKQEMKQDRDVAAFTQNEFYSLLKRRFHSLIGAWRRCIDPMNDGKVGYISFCKNCHTIGFSGDLKMLWNSLHSRSRTRGFVDLAGFDPVTFEELTRFALLIFEENRNLNDAWRWSINFEKGAQISLETFTKYCVDHGFNGNIRKIFQSLDKNYEHFLTRDGFDLLRHWDPSLPSLHKNAKLTLTKELAIQQNRELAMVDGDDVLAPIKKEEGDTGEVFSFQVVLGPAEYAEFLRKRAASRAIDGSAWIAKDVRPSGLTVHTKLGLPKKAPNSGQSFEDLLALT